MTGKDLNNKLYIKKAIRKNGFFYDSFGSCSLSYFKEFLAIAFKISAISLVEN